MKSGMPKAAYIAMPLPGQVNNLPWIRIEIALTQHSMHTAIDTTNAEKAPGMFVQEGT